MSNHIAKSVNWLPEIRSSATRTIVGVVISFPFSRRIASTAGALIELCPVSELESELQDELEQSTRAGIGVAALEAGLFEDVFQVRTTEAVVFEGSSYWARALLERGDHTRPRSFGSGGQLRLGRNWGPRRVSSACSSCTASSRPASRAGGRALPVLPAAVCGRFCSGRLGGSTGNAGRR